MPRKPKLKMTLGHWYRLRGGGYVKLMSRGPRGTSYPYSFEMFAVREYMLVVGDETTSLPSGRAIADIFDDENDIVEHVGTKEPRPVSAFRELTSWAKAALNGQEDCIAVALPTKRKPRRSRP